MKQHQQQQQQPHKPSISNSAERARQQGAMTKPSQPSSSDRSASGIIKPSSAQQQQRRSQSQSPARGPAAPSQGGPSQLSKEQQLALKLKQDTARKVFYAQKLPDMDRLWLHQLLISHKNRKKRIKARRAGLFGSLNNLVEAEHASQPYDPSTDWRASTAERDATARLDADNQLRLDRARLADIQIYGYDKYNKSRQRRIANPVAYDPVDQNRHYRYYSAKEAMRRQEEAAGLVDDGSRFSGASENSQFARGILTEHFQTHTDYVCKKISRNHRALVPVPRRYLRNQYLLTPRYLADNWHAAVGQSGAMKPRIILIDDDERIVRADRSCRVYVQYVLGNEGVLGADRAYQLMLPNRGPTSPTRPLLVAKGDRLTAGERANPMARPEMALREAPVFVYHADGTRHFEVCLSKICSAIVLACCVERAVVLCSVVCCF